MPTTTTYSDDPGRVLNSDELFASTHLVQVKKGLQVSEQALRLLLPDISTLLFFAKTYELDYHELSQLVLLLHGTNDVIAVLLSESDKHSIELQDYLVTTVPDVQSSSGGITFTDDTAPVDTVLLRQLFEEASTSVAQSIKDVASKLEHVLSRLTTKEGQMTFSHLYQLNRQRASIGDYGARIEHRPVPPRLVILDVSGSMTEDTIRSIVDEVVSLAYNVNASLAIVSESAFLWDAGTFDSDTVLRHAEFWGTHYEKLAPVLQQDWDTVVTIADYDSSGDAKRYLGDTVRGRIRQVLDISLVNRPTFLSECVGQFAQELTPLLIGASRRVLGS